MKLNPYLMFNGNCQIQAMMTAAGTPMEQDVPPERRDKIMHARLTIGDTVLMGSDAPPDAVEPMQGFNVTLNIDEPAEAERVFRALSEKARTVAMPIQDTFWARRFGIVVDQFGTPWMINCEKPMG